jgi:hypothetical protein
MHMRRERYFGLDNVSYFVETCDFRAKNFDAFNDAFNEFFLLSPKPDFEPKG